MRASGRWGELRVAYQRAAWLGTWTLEQASRIPTAYTFTARLVRTHEYWATQRPMDLVIGVGATEWRWRDVTVAWHGTEVTIELTERPVVSDRQVDDAPAVNRRGGGWR